MSQQLINLGSVANDGTGSPLRTGGQDINANFTELYTLRTPVVAVADYGAVGDGVTDDTAAIQAAENARTAGQTLWFTPGKTYLCSQTTPSSLLQVKVSGLWDFRGSTIKYGGASNLGTGSDFTTGSSQVTSKPTGMGLINVLVNDVRLLGTVDGNQKLQYVVTWAQTVTAGRIDLTLKNSRDKSFGATYATWSGLNYCTSADVTGITVSAGQLATGIGGILARPDCPMQDGTDTITAHQPVVAFVFGGAAPISDGAGGNSRTFTTGGALVQNDNQGFQIAAVRLDSVGVINGLLGAGSGASYYNMDFMCHDLDNIVQETCGSGTQNNYGFNNGSGSWGQVKPIGHLLKNGCVVAWYDYNPSGPSTRAANVFVGGGSGAGLGEIWLAGRLELSNVTSSAGASLTPDFAKGNDFVCTANASPTINTPSNLPVNPSGISLVHFFNVTIRNVSAGAITTTWNANYHLAGPWTDPAAGKERSVWFRYDAAKGIAYEIGRSAADVTT